MSVSFNICHDIISKVIVVCFSEPIPDKYDTIQQPDPHVIDIIKLYQRRLNQFDENNKTLTESEKEYQDEVGYSYCN